MERNGKVVVIDILASDLRDDIMEFVSEFSESKNTHGTGCTLACISSVYGTDCSGYCGEYCVGI